MVDDKPPSGLRADVALARDHAAEAIGQLIKLMAASDARISLAAATALLDRAYGKPAPPADMGEDETGPIYSVIKRVIIDRAADQDT